MGNHIHLARPSARKRWLSFHFDLALRQAKQFRKPFRDFSFQPLTQCSIHVAQIPKLERGVKLANLSKLVLAAPFARAAAGAPHLTRARQQHQHVRPRFSWVPKIETVLIKNNETPPQGGGEPAIILMGALIANAIHDATGARLFQLPMTPDRVKAALQKV
jgi:hypothetical protein